MIRTEPAPLRRSLWIPWTIAGCFVIVVAVNVLMAWCAAWSWTGLVSPSAYDQGLTYNRNLAAEMHQRMLGWHCRFTAAGGVARVELRDRDGAPLTGAEVTATLRAPGPRRQRLRPAARGRGRGRLRGAGDRARAGPVEGPRHRPPRRRPLRDRHPPRAAQPVTAIALPAAPERRAGARRARAGRPPLRPRRIRGRAQRPPSAGRGRALRRLRAADRARARAGGGLETARVNLTTRRLTLRWPGDPARGNALARAVTSLGFGVVPFDPERLAATGRKEEAELLRCVAVAGFAASQRDAARGLGLGRPRQPAWGRGRAPSCTGSRRWWHCPPSRSPAAPSSARRSRRSGPAGPTWTCRSRWP